MAALTITLEDATSLRKLFEDQLSKGRAFVPASLPGAEEVHEREPCDLFLEHGGRAHKLVTEVVHVRREDPGRGVGLQLAKLDAAGLAALKAFVEGASFGTVEEPPPPPASPPPAEPDEPEQAGAREDDEPEDDRPQNLTERLAGLTGVEQLKLAAAGTLQERVGLERMYGPHVWETLLRNNRLTPPEAARIARKGTLPRPLVELVAANAGWLAVGEVQRALLSNPRSSQVVVLKVLRMMSRSDLLLVPHQTAYPMSVRQAAKGMLGRA